MKSTVERLRNVVSYSEIEGIKAVIQELGESNNGVIIAAKIADKSGITRSILVNGMKLLEAAGVVETRSLGMKGTLIKVLDRATLNELLVSSSR